MAFLSLLFNWVTECHNSQPFPYQGNLSAWERERWVVPMKVKKKCLKTTTYQGKKVEKIVKLYLKSSMKLSKTIMHYMFIQLKCTHMVVQYFFNMKLIYLNEIKIRNIEIRLWCFSLLHLFFPIRISFFSCVRVSVCGVCIGKWYFVIGPKS